MDSVFLGRNASSFRRRGQTGTITKVTLVVDEENFFSAGDDTGDELTADCAWATQDMADAVLAQVGGKQIPGFTADEALLDISTEVGDGVTVCDTYSVAGSIESTLDLMDTASVALSVSGDVEQEYAAAGSIERKIARVRKSVTQLTVKAGEISAEITNVENELSNRIDLTASGMDAKIEDAKNGLKNEITATANSLSANISATDGRVTALSASLDSMTLSVSNGSESSTISLVKDGVTVSSKTVKFTGDVIFASDLTDGTTMISGNNILTGTISADRLDISGAINSFLEADGVAAINFVDDRGSMQAQIVYDNGYDSLTINSNYDLQMRGNSITFDCSALVIPFIDCDSRDGLRINFTNGKYCTISSAGIDFYDKRGNLISSCVLG